MAGVAYRGVLALALAGSMLGALQPASAQPVVDQALQDAQLAVQKGCAILKVNFTFRVRYASHFPLDRGDELWITVNAIDRNQAAALTILTREAATVPGAKLHGIKTITFETQHPTGPVLRILFDHPVAYKVATGADAQSIVVAVAGAKPLATCNPIFPGAAYETIPIGGGRNLPPGAPGGPSARPTGAISEADLRTVAGWMDEGRAALRHNNPAGAIQIFRKILKYPENQYSAEAQELLGLAYQKSGQLHEAKAEYEDYLRRYPSGEQSERVRQRLAGIVTANDESSAVLREPGRLPSGAPPIGRFAPVNETVWTLVGSASSFYIRDDSLRAVRDSSAAPDPTADPDAHRVHQNEMLSSLDLTATWNNAETKGKIRFSGSEEHRFDTGFGSSDLAGVAAFSVDTLVKDWNLRTVAGRQYLNTDGVLGRFDGALFSWQALPMLRVDLVGGTPALSRFDLPFKDDRYFYAAGLGLGPYWGSDTTLYAIEQRDQWLVDREAVGAEWRYNDPNKFAFGNVDYDLHFQQLNAAIFSGSWILPDKSTIYGGADYRRTPFLSTWNAVINQPFVTLYDMLKAQSNLQQTQASLQLTNEQVLQLQQCLAALAACARDQTPIYKSAMLGFSHPLSDHLQVSADATIVNLSQPLSPFNDPSLTLPAGNEYYYSTQLMGNNFFKDGDMYIAAVRYSQLETSHQYVLDLNTRFPLTNEWRLSPRLRLGYMVGTGGVDLKQYTVLPSFLVDYYWTKELSFEAEIGAQWTSSIQSGVKSRDTELLATIGLRYDFYADTSAQAADDKNKLLSPAAAALCRYSARPDSGSCAPSVLGSR
jgi:tetratricopeptide (TPR) repeat protein